MVGPGTAYRLRTRTAGRCSGGAGRASVVSMAVEATLILAWACICWVRPGVSEYKKI